MAKLSARGRKEVARLSKEGDPGRELVSWERVTVTLMSDGKVLEKRDVVFQSDGRKHTWGWKVRGKMAKGQGEVEFKRYFSARGFS